MFLKTSPPESGKSHFGTLGELNPPSSDLLKYVKSRIYINDEISSDSPAYFHRLGGYLLDRAWLFGVG
jgi:hypothetical protein